jgi:lipoprotein signal peptidase
VQQALHLERLISVPFLGPLRLTWVQNPGVTFGMFGGHADLSRWGLAAFAAVIAIALAVWARSQTRLLVLVGIGLLIGGATGNLIDRVRLGAVIDFFDASALWFPWVFNFADICVDVGVALLLIDSLLGEKKTAKNDAAT